jgi:hypothetical protein
MGDSNYFAITTDNVRHFYRLPAGQYLRRWGGELFWLLHTSQLTIFLEKKNLRVLIILTKQESRLKEKMQYTYHLHSLHTLFTNFLFTLSLILPYFPAAIGQKTTTFRLRDPQNNPYHYRRRTQSSYEEEEEDSVVMDVLHEDAFFWSRQLRIMSMSCSLFYGSPDIKEAADNNTTNKTTWPECVNIPLTCEECEAYILGEKNPYISLVNIIPYDSFVTADYRTDRVRIFCNGTNVTSIPIIG